MPSYAVNSESKGQVNQNNGPSEMLSETYNSHMYKLYSSDCTWEQANTFAESIGGHLATITSAEENEVLKHMFADSGCTAVWLGASDESSEGDWKWITKEKWSFTDWGNNEPNGERDENHLAFYNGYWSDFGKNSKSVNGFIVEFDLVDINNDLEFTLNDDGVSYSVTGIGNCDCKDVIIPSEFDCLPVIGIAERAFYECLNLESIVISENVKDIGRYAFYGCKNLVSISMGNGVTHIGFWAFGHCDGLKNVVLGNGVVDIDNSAFEYCKGLVSITIKNSIKHIGDYTFMYCGQLTTINFKGTTTQWNAVEKGSAWDATFNSNCSYNVYCTDGTISK